MNKINKDNITLYHEDCLVAMEELSDKSVDMILCDLPYGTTNCKWDSIIPLDDFIICENKKLSKEEFYLKQFKKNILFKEVEDVWNSNKKKGLWSHYNRIIKDNGVIVLFAQTPFDKILGNSNLKMLRYEWIWEKTQATGHLNAKKMPMKAHENILIFYKKLPTYNPQKTTGHNPINSYTKYVKTQNNTEIYGEMKKEIKGGGDTDRYPRSVQIFSSDKQKCCLHPTQKPEKLCEYLIKTYTNEGAIILDNCMGSGTTGVSVLNVGGERVFIGIENQRDTFFLAKNRIFGVYYELYNKGDN